MYSLRYYSESDKELWNEFVKNSVNGTFIHDRSYMDYHKDRFEDASLIVLDQNNRPLALLPANKKDNVLYSHQGLTYGGLLHDKHMTTVQVVEIFQFITEFLLKEKFITFYYKEIPSFYHRYPSQADVYALFLQGARMSRRDTYSVVDLKSDKIPEMGSQRVRALKKAAKAGLVVAENLKVEPFYFLLEKVLMLRHETKPTHSLDELNLLRKLFPENIRVYECSLEGQLLAGIVIYENEGVAHAQYIATSEEGQKCGALDFLFVEIMNKYRQTCQYFSFGISNENNGLYLNKGLIGQKEGFGARSLVHDHYVLDIEKLSNFEKEKECL